MTKLVVAASLVKIRLHDLEHLHATTLLLSGVPVHVVAVISSPWWPRSGG
jgi:hypothetical protein